MNEIVHKIYTLSNPKTEEIRYIGYTKDPLEIRLNGHLNSTKYEEKKYYNLNWIQSLVNMGLKPKIELLEITSLDNWKADEKYWIRQMRAWGFKLTNLSEGGDVGGNIELLKKPILQYDLDGNFIKEWKSAREVQKQISIKYRSISMVCKGKRQSTGGYIWKYKNNNSVENIIPKYIGKIIKRIPILQYDLNGNFIQEFNNANIVIKKFKFLQMNLSSCCLNKRKSTGGFMWRYKQNNIIPLQIEKYQKINSSKSVLQFDKQLNYIRKFNSIIEAANFTNIKDSNIGYCCKNKRKTAGGYIWKYANEIDTKPNNIQN